MEWEQTVLSKIFTFKNGLNKEKEAFNLKGKVELSKKEIDNYSVQKGDVFFARTSETINEIGLSSVMLDDTPDTVFSGFVLRASPCNDKIVDK